MPDLLRVPDVGVEVPVDLGRVGQHRGQLEHVAVHLELDPGHVVEDVPEPRVEWSGSRTVKSTEARSIGGCSSAIRSTCSTSRSSVDRGWSRRKNTVRDVRIRGRSRSGWVRRPVGRSSRPPTLGSGMTLLDGTVVNVALPDDRRGPRRRPGPAAVDHQRLPALAGLPDPARRLARRPVRAAPDVRHRHDLVRRGLAAVRARPQRRGADRGPDPAGRRRRAAHAGQPGDDPGRLPRRGPARRRSVPGPAWAASPRRSGRSSAASSSSYASWRWIFLINLPLAAVTVLIAVRHVPETPGPARVQRLRRAGAVLAMAALAGSPTR